MREITYAQAGLEAVAQEMRLDPKIFYMSTDAIMPLLKEFGEKRIKATPIAEGAIIGAAIGMGVNGLRPVAEVQFADYIYPACDQIFSELARLRYRCAGEFWAPVTIRTP